MIPIDPVELTAEERTQELVQILAIAVWRWRRLMRETPVQIDTNALDLSSDMSVTEHDG
ncbi:MAG: hypothetical protein LC104_09625 [Bacteroidales bacterium]|nr:hypothetical protein [Bacteroidales bacterium]